jgi:L-malate glycosyltransferase
LKILHLIQKPQLRGAEMFASQLSTHLQEAGHDVLLVSLLTGNAQLSFSGNHISLQRPLAKRFIDVQGWRLLAQHIQEFKPDVIQANAGDTLKYAVFSKLMFGWKAPIILRNANKVSDFINTTPKLLFNRFLVSRLHHVISVSELCRQDFIDTYSYNPTAITTVPIGIELPHLQESLPSDVKSFFQQGKVLLHVASFVPEKNHAGLLRIMKNVLAVNKTIQLLLVGDGKLRVEIEKQIQTEKLRDNVHVLGYRHDVLSLMQHASACVLTSLIEGLPGVILEAMYCQSPVSSLRCRGY